MGEGDIQLDLVQKKNWNEVENEIMGMNESGKF